VTGKADIDTPPDLAVCSFTIKDIEHDPGKANATVDARLKAVLAVLSENDVASSDIESSNLSKQILSNEYGDKEPAQIRGYDLTRSLQFKLRKLVSLAAIEDELIGAANVEQIHCQFDRTDRAAIEADLLVKALHSAKQQGDHLAEPLGRHVTAAVAVSETPFESIPAAFGLGDQSAGFVSVSAARMFKKSASADELLVPATIHMSVAVNVLFKMD